MLDKITTHNNRVAATALREDSVPWASPHFKAVMNFANGAKFTPALKRQLPFNVMRHDS